MTDGNGRNEKVVIVRPEIRIVIGPDGKAQMRSTIQPLATLRVLTALVAQLAVDIDTEASKRESIIRPVILPIGKGGS